MGWMGLFASILVLGLCDQLLPAGALKRMSGWALGMVVLGAVVEWAITFITGSGGISGIFSILT